MFNPDRPPTQLLFPRVEQGREEIALDQVAKSAGWQSGAVRSKMFRHSYCSARLQTLDRGEPVSEFTVAREMGHGGHALVRRIYGHLGPVRHRSEVVEHRAGDHAQVLGDRLVALSSVTNLGPRT